MVDELKEDDPNIPATAINQQNIYFSVWSKAIDTQMHFNDMSARSRQFGLGFVTAALSFGVVLLGTGRSGIIPVHIGSGGFDLNGVVFIILVSIVGLQAVRQLDLNVYHKMLRGSVAFGEDFEKTYMKTIFDLEKGMTQAITHFSRYQDAKVQDVNGRQQYDGKRRKYALEKIEDFYNLATISLVLLAALVFFVTANFGHP